MRVSLPAQQMHTAVLHTFPLAGFDHPVLHNHNHDWSLECAAATIARKLPRVDCFSDGQRSVSGFVALTATPHTTTQIYPHHYLPLPNLPHTARKTQTRALAFTPHDDLDGSAPCSGVPAAAHIHELLSSKPQRTLIACLCCLLMLPLHPSHAGS